MLPELEGGGYSDDLLVLLELDVGGYSDDLLVCLEVVELVVLVEEYGMVKVKPGPVTRVIVGPITIWPDAKLI